MPTKALKIVRPDSKGRITLGSLTIGVSGFSITSDKDNRIILVPLVEIPAREKWLFNNKRALQQVEQGLKESAEGQVKSRGSFAQYKDEDD